MKHTTIVVPRSAPAPETPSVTGAARAKVAVWLYESSWYRISRALLRLGCVIVVVAGFAAPQLLIDAVRASLSFHDALLPKAGTVISILFYGRRWLRLGRRLQARVRAGGNQHTFHGIPIDELASYLLTQLRFTREHAMDKLSLSQPKHKKIAEVLEQAGVLFRGECNALELRAVSREQLVTILRALASKKGSPLVFDPERSEWFERDGMANRWILDREQKEREAAAALERTKRRIERKEESLDEQLEGLAHSPFVSRLIRA